MKIGKNNTYSHFKNADMPVQARMAATRDANYVIV